MRISQLPIWLTVTWSAGLRMVAGAERYLTWTEKDFVSSNGAAVFKLQDTNTSLKEFHWTTSTDITINSVSLTVNGLRFGRNATTPRSNGATPTPLPTPSSEIENRDARPGIEAATQVANSDFEYIFYTVSKLAGSVTIIDLNSFRTTPEGMKMRFEVLFSVLGEGGAAPTHRMSTSRVFTVDSGRTANDNDPQFRANETSETPYTPTTAATGFSTPMSTASSISGGISSSNPSPDSSAQSSTGGSGLAPGPIAGIAVGVVIGLLLVGALVWWLVHRNRRAREPAMSDKDLSAAFSPAMAYGGPNRNRTQELMAEKEANVGLDPGPHSPYSDDGGPTSSSNGAVAVAGVAAVAAGAAGVLAHAQHQRQHQHQHQHQQPTPTQAYQHDAQSFVPYSDHPSSSPVLTSASAAGAAAPLRSPSTRISQHSASQAAIDEEGRSSPTGGRATPLTSLANQPTPYVHLVEEGMTEDDIRRLEEEERELDQAIERAGRGGSGSGGGGGTSTS